MVKIAEPSSVVIHSKDAISSLFSYIEYSLEIFELSKKRKLQEIDNLPDDNDPCGMKHMSYQLFEHEYVNIIGNDHESLPQILHVHTYSLIPLIYSILEKHLWETAYEVQNQRFYQLAPRNMDGRGIEKPINYLRLVANINTDSLKDSADWNKIKDLEKVRNIILHDSGLISATNKKDKDINKLIEKYFPKLFLFHNLSGCWDYKSLGIKIEVCKEFLESIKIFLSNLFTACGFLTDSLSGIDADQYYSTQISLVKQAKQKELEEIELRYSKILNRS